MHAPHAGATLRAPLTCGSAPLACLRVCSGYDFGYLLKVLTCVPLPPTEDEFFELLRLYFPNVIDIKYIIKQPACANTLHGGLKKISEQLDVSGRDLSAGLGLGGLGSAWRSVTRGDVVMWRGGGRGPVRAGGGTTTVVVVGAWGGRGLAPQPCCVCCAMVRPQVQRIGPEHQAGSDSLLTLQVRRRSAGSSDSGSAVAWVGRSGQPPSAQRGGGLAAARRWPAATCCCCRSL